MKKLISMKKIMHRLKAKSYKLKANEGQAAIASVLFFVALMLAISFGFSSLALSQEKITRTNLKGKQSYFIAEAGQEDVVYRLMNGMDVGTEEVLAIDENYATTTNILIAGNRIVSSDGDTASFLKTVEIELANASIGIAFNYGVQAGAGGVLMENNSLVSGNLYSNGPVTGENNNLVRGTVVSASAAGLIDDVNATSSAYAHTIRDAFIEGNAYYQVISGTTVLGTQFPGSSDLGTSTLPITDEQIEGWKAQALAGGTISAPCPYKITSNTTIGPVKIACDLEIEGSPTVTLNGMIWVSGNIIIQNNAIVQAASSLGSQSIAVVADNPANRSSGSTITLQNDTIYKGSGATGSNIMFVSQNNSSEQGGSNVAINLKNNAKGALLAYAAHGEILIENNLQLKEVTAYKIHTKNNTILEYETGLANILFTSGPSGGYSIIDWKEVE